MAPVICGNCGKTNDAGTELCLQCGRILAYNTTAEPAPTEDAGAGAPAMRLCANPGCRQPLDSGATECGTCFTPVHSAVDDPLVLVFPWGRWALKPGEMLFIGRADGWPLARELACFDTVGRRHAQVERAAEAAYVTDLGSLNGTFIDGRRLTAGVREQLTAGQILGFSSKLEARLEEESA